MYNTTAALLSYQRQKLQEYRPSFLVKTTTSRSQLYIGRLSHGLTDSVGLTDWLTDGLRLRVRCLCTVGWAAACPRAGVWLKPRLSKARLSAASFFAKQAILELLTFTQSNLEVPYRPLTTTGSIYSLPWYICRSTCVCSPWCKL